MAYKMENSFRDLYFHYRKAASRADSLARHAGLEAISGQIPELFMRLYDQIRKLRVNRCQKSAVTTRVLFNAFASVGIHIYRTRAYILFGNRPRSRRNYVTPFIYTFSRGITLYSCNRFLCAHWSMRRRNCKNSAHPFCRI